MQLVSAPYRDGDGRHQFEEALRTSQVVRDADGSADGLVRIGDRAIAPSADLVAEQPEPAGPSCSDRTRGDDASFWSLVVPGADSITNRPSGPPTSRAV
jgi:hypothetical protein